MNGIELVSYLNKDKDLLFYWISERDSIRVKKEAGLPKPWTDDPILQKFKFCNVRREDDRVTKWIKDNWREPYRGHPNMWFAMVVARIFNWPPTLELIGFPSFDGVTSNFEGWKAIARKELKYIRDDQKGKVFTGAYLISTNGVSMDKIDYVLDRVLTPIWERGSYPAKLMSKWPDEPLHLQEYWNHLCLFDGLVIFMAGQVIADRKYVDPVLEKAPDWLTWAPLGPGSIRGLNRFHGRPYDRPLKQEQGLKELREIRQMIRDAIDFDLPVHDVQNCMCEYDKFLRVVKKQGTPRSHYPGV